MSNLIHCFPGSEFDSFVFPRTGVLRKIKANCAYKVFVNGVETQPEQLKFNIGDLLEVKFPMHAEWFGAYAALDVVFDG